MPVSSVTSAVAVRAVTEASQKTKIEAAVAQPTNARLKKVTQEFEAVFIGMMLKQMRKCMTGDAALLGSSSEAKLYQDMMDDAMAQQMSRAGSFGLARTLYQRLEPNVAPPSEQG